MPDQPSPADAAEPRARAVRPRALLLLVGLLAALSFLRVHELELDPPNVVVRGYRGQAHYRDEPAKAHEARNKAKWARWSLSEADEYEFWRAQSPAWVWGEYLWFRAFGVGLVQARTFVVAHTILALALLCWLALIRHGLPAALASAALLGLNWAYLVYSRLALMEGALIAWLLVATVALSQIDRRPRQAAPWTALAVVAMFIACTIKQTGLLLVPAFALALPLLGLRAAGVMPAGAELRRWSAWKAAARAGLRRRELVATIAGVAALGLALAALIFNPEYQQRLAFNAEHFTAAREQPVLGRAATTLLRNLFGASLWLMYFRLAPLIMWLASLELARIVLVAPLLRRRARKRGAAAPSGPLFAAPDLIDWWMLAWAILALLANLASPHRAIRFQLVMLPPAAWLGGALVARIWTQRLVRAHVQLAIRTAVVGLALVGASVTMVRFVAWRQTEQRTAAELGEQLEALIGDRHAVVVGEFAAQAVFETGYWHFYVRPHQFNTSDEIIEALEITHLVSAGEDQDFVEDWLAREQPQMLVDRRELGKLEFRGRTLTVWQLAPFTERELERGGLER